MLFHKIIRLKPSEFTSIGANVAQKKFIIPLVSPGSAAGQFLLSKEESAILSSYSKTTDIYFVAKESLEAFEEFTNRVIKETVRKTGIVPKNPAAIAFDSAGNVFVLDALVSDDMEKFENTMYALIDALDSPRVEDAMERIQRNLQIGKLSKAYGEHVKELLKFILELFGIK